MDHSLLLKVFQIERIMAGMHDLPRPTEAKHGARLGTEPLSRMSACLDKAGKKVQTAMVTVALGKKFRQY